MPFKEGSASAEFRKMRKEGLTLPSNPVRGRIAAKEILNNVKNGSMMNDVGPMAMRGESKGRGSLQTFSSIPNMDGMASTANRRMGAAHGSDAQWAWPKLHDPFEYWRERTWWFNMEDPDEQMRKIRDWARLLYTTHYLVPSLIDIYTRYPLLDIELYHKDKRISQFYTELFFDGLDYQEFLFDLGREHWTVGEVFAMGSWHDGIGAWEDDEIINPNDVIVAKNRALRTYKYNIKVPDEIKKLIETREPQQEYQMLTQLYPDVVQWARQDKEIPVSDVIMKQIKFKTNPWSEHGTPILLRAFRMLMLEESLNAAQDAIADRLYSPLILATLGLPNVDEDGPWIPDATELQALRDDLAMAINSDFRLMTYHHGLQIQNAFGRESMPRLDSDFMRVESKVMQVFGIGAELLQGGRQTGTYASGALNRELITQMLSTYQHKIKKFFESRMATVAERQGHYEYRNVGGQKVPIMETVLMVDDETGEEYVEERPKLAVPEVRFRSMNLRDETIERGFLQQLQASGFPISLGTLAVNIPIDFDNEVSARKEEKIKTVIAEQEFKRDLFNRLFTLQLPIPPEYVQEYMAYVAGLEDPAIMAQLAPQAMADLTSIPGAPNMGGPASPSDVSGVAEVYPSGPIPNPRQRPEESDSAKKNQPKQERGRRKNGPNKKSSFIREGEEKIRIPADVDTTQDLMPCPQCGIDYDGQVCEHCGFVAPKTQEVLLQYQQQEAEKAKAQKKSSVTTHGWDEDDDFDKPFEKVTYGDRMKFAAPIESKQRKRMVLAKGMNIIVDDSYEKFNEEEFKEHLASRLSTSIGMDEQGDTRNGGNPGGDDGEEPGITGDNIHGVTTPE